MVRPMTFALALSENIVVPQTVQKPRRSTSEL